MQPVKMKTEVPTDLEGIRQLLLGMAPHLEPRQPGITNQLQQANLSQPMMMAGKSGETVTIIFEPQSTATAIKVEVRPPFKPMGKLRQKFWRWRTRLMLKVALKRAKLEVEKKQRAHQPKVDAQGVIQPEVLPPEK